MKWLDTLKDKILGCKCSGCGSRDRRQGIWIRAYDHRLLQAIGSLGWRCYDCGKIDFDTSFAQFNESLDSECTHYDT